VSWLRFKAVCPEYKFRALLLPDLFGGVGIVIVFITFGCLDIQVCLCCDMLTAKCCYTIWTLIKIFVWCMSEHFRGNKNLSSVLDYYTYHLKLREI
jgi:hypothetical protein